MRPIRKVLLFLLLMVHSSLAQEIKSRPNIIFILADDLGVNDLHCYGRKDHRTPNLDRLATQGARFTSAYCAQPICSPSRAAILTGKAPARLHLTTYLPGRADCSAQKLLHPKMRQELPKEEKTLAEYLKEYGYATACIGKWHLGGKGVLPTDQGFDFYHPGKATTRPDESEGGKGEYDLTAQAESFIETNRHRPFFLYLPHNSPHIPFSARSNLVNRNSSAFNPVYAALIETLDDAVGRLLTKLESLQLTTNTMVIFTSDNGGLHVPEGGHQTITHNSPFRAGKGYLYEGGLRIPLIVRWPGRIPSRVIETPVINTGWLPTLLELVGARAPGGLDGKSFAASLRGGKKSSKETFFWHFPHYNNQGGRPAGAIREGDWKMIEHYEDGKLELFNLDRDQSETRDLAEQNKKRVEKMRQQLDRWRKEVGAQTNSLNPEFNPELHRALYVKFDPSRYQPNDSRVSSLEDVLKWRKGMNEALTRRSP